MPAWKRQRCSGKVVAAHRTRVCRPKPRNGHRTGPVDLAVLASRIEKRAQDCEWQDLVPGVRSIVDRHGDIRLSRKRADPLAILVLEAAKFPMRHFERDQS